jgi:hypothetical protein
MSDLLNMNITQSYLRPYERYYMQNNEVNTYIWEHKFLFWGIKGTTTITSNEQHLLITFNLRQPVGYTNI